MLGKEKMRKGEGGRVGEEIDYQQLRRGDRRNARKGESKEGGGGGDRRRN